MIRDGRSGAPNHHWVSLRFTDATVAALKVSEGKSELLVFDEVLPGFGLRIRMGGKRTWVVQYRLERKQRRFSLGSVGSIDAVEARRRAKSALAKVALGQDPQAEKVEARHDGEPLRLVTVGSWERRKNLLRLLRAIARAQREAPIVLTLVGRRGLDPVYDAEVNAALAMARDVVVTGSLSDDVLIALILESHATVYPSWEEGFGLPVGESLWLGRPCLCHNGSAMAEMALGGGSLAVDMMDEDGLVEALLAMAQEPDLLTRLGEEATARPLTSWRDYSIAVSAILDKQLS